jgi:glycosyltransferase involved in cell wall biosynthesis
MECDRLLINLSFLPSQPTGLATYAANLFPHLRSLEPILLSPTTIAGFDCQLVPPNLTESGGTKSHFRRLLWTQFQLPQIYQKLNASLLFSPIPEAPIYRQCPSVITVHDLIPLRFPRRFSPLTRYYRHYLPFVLQQARHIICNSQATARDLVDFFGISVDKITPILLAHDTNNFRPIALSETNKNYSCRYFIYVGRHDPHKNLARLIEAFAAISNNFEYQLWIVGNPDSRYTPKLKAQALELGREKQVKFLNYLPYEQLPILLNQAIALVFPSLWEGFGLPVLEAMACGTPVITSNLASLPEVAGEATLLVDPENTAEITAAMASIAEDSQLHSQLSRLGRERASQFSWEKTAGETQLVLQSFLS